MVAFPPCKINLGLRILRKRADGFHDLDTCFYPVPFTDILEIIPSSQTRFTSSGNVIPGDAADNLCLRAYALLSKDISLGPVAIHLHKVIPTGAGLGGGSSDAAWTLRLLNAVFSLNLGTDQLRAYAAKLGSDCAFFITDFPCLASGRGEVLEPFTVALGGKYVALFNPCIHVSTAEAYAGVRPNIPEKNVAEILASPLTNWKNRLHNDFEDSVFLRYPEISNLKEQLYNAGAIYASMSGSGSTVFGIFESEPALLELPAAKYLIWSGKL